MGCGRCKVSPRRLEATAYVRTEHTVQKAWTRGKRDGAICKDVETEEDLDHLKGIQRCCEGKGPTESNTTVQESTKRPEV